MSTARLNGLRHDEAARLLALHGSNELPAQQRRGIARIALGVLREPMLILLLVAAGAYALLGEGADTIAMLCAATFIVLITFVQEWRTENALYALRQLSSPQASVIRDGRVERIATRNVVPGDLLVLEEGDRVAADAVLISATSLALDESLLTGESVPVEKTVERVYAGTMVVRGHGIAHVEGTGAGTELGRIGAAIQFITGARSGLEIDTRMAVRWVGAAGILICIVIAAVSAWRGDPLETAVPAGLALAMALVPEEFPVVLTVLLALGARRLSRIGVLARRLSCVETLGSISLLCVDKTGTLTLNRLRVSEIATLAGNDRSLRNTEPEPALQEVLHAAALASSRDSADPVDRAILEASPQDAAHPPGTRAFRGSMWRGAAVATGDGNSPLLIIKGASESVIAASTASPAARQEWTALADAMAARGLKVLAVSRGNAVQAETPADGRIPAGLGLLGLIGLEDPVRPGAASAVAECQSAGIRIVMVSGDHPATARRVAAAVGLSQADGCLTGADLEAMTDQELAAKLGTTNVFARILPQQKLRLVRLYQAAGAIVAMTGDGVNDAPALRAAHVGIALGGRGTDVAREAAALVITDDDLTSIVAGIRGGRRIFRNLRHAFRYILAIHVPVAGLALAAVITGSPAILLPIHIALLELIIDPACSLVFEVEAESPRAMREPPRSAESHLLSREGAIAAVAQGLMVLISVLAVVAWARAMPLTDEQVRTLGFTAVVMGNLGLLLTNRAWSVPLWQALRRRNDALWGLILATALALGAGITTPAIRAALHLETVPALLWLVPVAAAMLATLAADVTRDVARRYSPPRG